MTKYIKKSIPVEASQWFKNGDHPQDECQLIEPDQKSTTQFEPFMSEGKVVRYFRNPSVLEHENCAYCHKEYHGHGWIDTLEGGHIVCPGDWIITGVNGEHYPCKPDIFEKTYTMVPSYKFVGTKIKDAELWEG